MKASFAAALAALAAHLVNAHYTFPDLIVAGTITADWQYVRMTDNHYSNGPVTDVTSSEMKCYESTTANVTSTYTLNAGTMVGFQADNTMGHPGYFDAYLSVATPTANTESAGSGNTWFKIWDWAPTYSPSTGLVFASEGQTQVTFQLPPQVPSGQYLLRIEQIALHLAETYGGAQLYLACAQLNVVNGGSGSPTPGPLTSFPGAYTGYEPGILINIYDLPSNYTGYTAPGPVKWPPGSLNSGQGSTVGSGTGTGTTTTTTAAKTTTTTTTTTTTSAKATTTTTTTTTAKATTTAITTTTSKAATTTTTSKASLTSTGVTASQYGQCGGTGYTGPTTCVSPYTCTYSNAYYSQCL